MGQLAKSGAAIKAAKAAADANDKAAVYDKLTGKMYFIGAPIDHFTPLLNNFTRFGTVVDFCHPGVDALQLGRVLSGDSYDTHAESGG